VSELGGVGRFAFYYLFARCLLFEYPGIEMSPFVQIFVRFEAISHRGGMVTAMQARERLLTPGEVATLFRVDPKTVTRWATAGRIGSIRTPGGHRRFRESEVNALLAELTTEAGNRP
jgi:excisionase family DNA binding protein